MSVDITLEKQISLKDIQEKTEIKIVDHDGRKYLSLGDNPENTLAVHIVNGFIDTITQYWGHSAKEIIDILVLFFQTRFITDNEVDYLIYEQMEGNELTPEELDNLWKETTIHYGFEINKNGVIIKK